MKTSPLLFCLAMLVPATAPAEPPAEPAAEPVRDSGFDRMWTGWGSANREALVRERSEAERLQRDLATADARRLRALRDQGRPLGERVGEIVREGDCEEGERVARAAGDFALVEAVRRHCGTVGATAQAPED